MRIHLIVILCFSAFLSEAVNDSLIFRFKSKHDVFHEEHQTQGGMKIGYNTGRFPDNYYFLFSGKTDTAFQNKNFDDSKWTVLNAEEAYDLKKTTFSGLGTFRLHYRFTDSTKNTPIVCEVFHRGASEIYVDGRLVKKFGKLGSSSKDEKVIIPRYEPFYIQHPDTSEHVLTIVYSNYAGVAKDRMQKGIEVRLYFFDDYQQEAMNFGVLHKFLVGLFAFFGALAIVHLLLFFADRSKRFNLFYSLFLLMVALTAFWPVAISYSESPGLSYVMDKVAMLFLPTCLFSLLNLMYSFFQKKFNFFYYLEAALYVLFVVCYVFKIDVVGALAYGALFFTTYFGVTILAIKALRKKYEGAKFLGWGILLFTILFIMGIAFTTLFNNDIFLFYFTALSLLALPLSMTAYLSYDFARTNKSLKQQLAANEELSRRTIEQEKEKQEILANQNKVLEMQVEERTREINEQKNLIEEKQTEILDSIRYAKRIQNSLMPTEKFILRTISKLRRKD
jgi:hypothetical protein